MIIVVVSIFSGSVFVMEANSDLVKQTLTHCGLVTPYGGRDLGQHWLR